MQPPSSGYALAGRRALVTGAGRGIGRSIALMLAQAGADVAVSARSQNQIDEVAAEIEALGCRAAAVPCDVTIPEDVERMAAHVHNRLGGVDILVNNAGMGYSHKFATHPDEMWHTVMAVNLHSAYYVTKAFVQGMIERRQGRIINIASVAAKVGGKYTAAYNASKHGVLGLTRSLAAELVSHNITVNAICPGYVDTPMTDGTVSGIVGYTGMSEEHARKYLESSSPQNRLIAPEEVAALTVFLASDLALGITGQAINIDGGAVTF